MPYYASADDWLRQSQLLLEARPATTRVTTKYSIRPAKPRRKAGGGEEETAADPATAKPPRGVLVLKTFDPKTGTALKYKTTKAAEVSRLVQGLGKLGRPMAGLPELRDEPMLDAPESGTGTPAGEKAAAAVGGDEKTPGAPAQGQQQQQQQAAGGGGGGKGKKKKGKR
ncbi:hypothetical protein JX265_009668 [Neoarthrinium moseri]|uniref:SRP9 domain-containing protein n=1 Tax=Neoarthrinium moseri TaxID=1658444 RepID=A0A9Q0AMA3_9PEZI|nr:hypothetical protein JX266_009742 [Neoarthrinium moseri]KAI1861049.1 hypothetical protein JX265_009668 [Neoarthrinium moseri]